VLLIFHEKWKVDPLLTDGATRCSWHTIPSYATEIIVTNVIKLDGVFICIILVDLLTALIDITLRVVMPRP